MTLPADRFLDRSNSFTNAHHLPTEIITIRPERATQTRQQLPCFIGISANTAGAQGISMNLVLIPPGAAATPHYHHDYETAIYLLQGQVETFYGQGLRQSVVNEVGDFIFIPPNVPHQPRNLSNSEPAYAIVARNNASEQETVVLYDPTLDQAKDHLEE